MRGACWALVGAQPAGLPLLTRGHCLYCGQNTQKIPGAPFTPSLSCPPGQCRGGEVVAVTRDCTPAESWQRGCLVKAFGFQGQLLSAAAPLCSSYPRPTSRGMPARRELETPGPAGSGELIVARGV